MRKKKTKHYFYFLEIAFWLDAHDEIANFHLILLLEVSKYLGFYPDILIDMPFFEMTEGVLHHLAP
jgi:DNA repair protein RecO (recombination protein O)